MAYHKARPYLYQWITSQGLHFLQVGKIAVKSEVMILPQSMKKTSYEDIENVDPNVPTQRLRDKSLKKVAEATAEDDNL